MSKHNRKSAAGEIGAFFADMAKDTARSLARLIGIILASGIAGTVIGAGVCLWYGAPLGFALVGGLLRVVLALVVLYAAADTF